jgi:hypothetical protein
MARESGHLRYALILGCHIHRRLEQLPVGTGGGRGNAHWTRFRCRVHQSFEHPLDTGTDRASRGIHDAVVRRCHYFNDGAHSATAARCARDGDPSRWLRSLARPDHASASIPEKQNRSPAAVGHHPNSPDAARQRSVLHLRNSVAARFAGRIVLAGAGLYFFPCRGRRKRLGPSGRNSTVIERDARRFSRR